MTDGAKEAISLRSLAVGGNGLESMACCACGARLASGIARGGSFEDRGVTAHGRSEEEEGYVGQVEDSAAKGPS